MNDKQKELYLNGTYGKIMGKKRELYKQGKLYDYEKATPYATPIKLGEFSEFNPEDVSEALKMRENRKNKTHRLKERMTYWAMNRHYSVQIHFVTFTLTNKTLEATTQDTRIQSIRRLLSTFTLDYWGNVDYGKTTQREHYHFVVVTEKGVNVELELEKITEKGFICVEPVGDEYSDIGSLSNYTDKLSLHALKIDTERNIIAKRGTDFHQFDELKHYIRKHQAFWLAFPEHHEALKNWLSLIDYELWDIAADHQGHLDYQWWFEDEIKMKKEKDRQ